MSLDIGKDIVFVCGGTPSAILRLRDRKQYVTIFVCEADGHALNQISIELPSDNLPMLIARLQELLPEEGEK